MRRCVCVHCGHEFETHSGKAKLCSDECRHGWHNARVEAYYAANREHVRALVASWKEANRERLIVTDRAYRATNHELLSAKNKAYREKNAERISAQRKERRRLRKLEADKSTAGVK